MDKSMEPTFFEGDRVLTFNWKSTKENNIIVFEENNRLLIKRVYKIKDNKIYVSGDNRKLSSNIGPIDFRQVVGRVVMKY